MQLLIVSHVSALGSGHLVRVAFHCGMAATAGLGELVSGFLSGFFAHWLLLGVVKKKTTRPPLILYPTTRIRYMRTASMDWSGPLTFDPWASSTYGSRSNLIR
jgi:hypothetical protein